MIVLSVNLSAGILATLLTGNKREILTKIRYKYEKVFSSVLLQQRQNVVHI